MEGTAYCYGAATIVNGIITGKGASFGIGLKTVANVRLTDDPGVFNVTIENDREEDPLLSECCVRNVLQVSGKESDFGADITTTSDIPISKGLKSSSTSANAITLATFRALGMKYTDLQVITMGVKASFDANVTLTGAYDDACASYFGKVMVTDNYERRILKQYSIEEDLTVLIHIPDEKIRKSEVDTKRMEAIRPLIDVAVDHAKKKDFKTGIILNGISYGTAMGLDTEVTMRALRNGACAAGISGTGPATVILCQPEKKDQIIEEIGKERMISTTINSIKAGFE